MDIKNIVFFGTPDFAVATLDSLLKSGYNVSAVVTVPDKPAGRGLKIRESDVKKYAVKNNLYILQPDDLGEEKFLKQLKEIGPDFQIVVAFRKLPKEVYTLAPMGTINLHASLLPQYRGAAPINWAIINGEKETGVTTFYINDRIDEGYILLQRKTDIMAEDDAGSLYERLKVMGTELVIETLKGIAENRLKPRAQIINEGVKIRKAPKIQKSDCKINWNLKGEDIINHIRALSPYPGAYTEIISKEGNRYYIKIYSAKFELCDTEYKTVGILTDGKTYLNVVVEDGLIGLLIVQMTGKTNMYISAFLRGFQLNNDFRVCMT